MTPADRAELARMTYWTRGYAEEQHNAGRISDQVFDAYMAVWWYSAPRFQDRSFGAPPYVREINAALDAEEHQEQLHRPVAVKLILWGTRDYWIVAVTGKDGSYTPLLHVEDRKYGQQAYARILAIREQLRSSGK